MPEPTWPKSEKPEEEPREKLSETLLGYDNPKMAEILAETEEVFSHNISASNGMTHLYGDLAYPLMPPEFVRLLDTIKGEVQGGIFVDAGCGSSPDVRAAGRLGINRVVGIDLLSRPADSPDPKIQPYTEDEFWQGKTILKIGDEITRGLARMKSSMVNIVHMRALDIFSGDEELCLDEIHRVLKDGGYFILDSSGNSIFRKFDLNKFEEVINYGDEMRILKKKTMEDLVK
ncbi:MAG: methyltransferase domain-containing protein [Candidatus Moraniibacteriota bacterium]|nr:MAG: methyltransferase domain-containing protein [Candidatus Moranbacteria bacterium]